MEKVAIVVPIYKKNLNKSEELSYYRLNTVLKKYDVFYIMPESLDVDFVDNCRIIFFPDEYFRSVDDYNRLMLSSFFYSRFLNYEYILIYQLDALIFYDRLMYFCGLNYDYIGAPWLGGSDIILENEKKSLFVGNGGFSLRNTHRCYNLLNDNVEFVNNWSLNEDLFFSYMNSERFKVAPFDVALEFAVESNVRVFMSLTKDKIPMGCHAWEKFDTRRLMDYWDMPKAPVKIGNNDSLGNNYWAWNILVRRGPLYSPVYSSAKRIITDMISSKKIAIYGAGHFGIMVKDSLESLGYKITNFYDSSIAKIDEVIDGVEVINSDYVCFDNIVIMATISDIENIENLLSSKGGIKNSNYYNFLDIGNRIILDWEESRKDDECMVN